MKILEFIYELVPGGAERFVVDLSNQLAEDNDVVLYTLRDDTLGNSGFYVPEISGKVEYHNLKISPGFNPMLIWRFFRLIRKEKPSVVHCHLNLVNYFFLSSLLLRNRVRFFYTIHNSAETEIEARGERFIRRFFFKYRYFVPVAISDETKKSYLSFFNLKEVPVIYNGRMFKGKSADFDKAAVEVKQLKPSDKTKVLCHLSRFDEKQKNHTMLIRVFNRVCEEGHDIILLIIGEGFENADSLRQLANSKVHFLGIRSNATDYLYLSDAFCLSSNFEGMPISLIEALACGCPPICTPVGGIVNSVEHGVTGYLSLTGSGDDFFDAVIQFLESGDKIDKSLLTESYRKNFGIEQCADRYMNLFRE